MNHTKSAVPTLYANFANAGHDPDILLRVLHY